MLAPALIVSGGASVAHSTGLLKSGETGLPYPLFVFLGAVLWQTFLETATLAHRAIEGARSYITRVRFSREALILAQVYEILFVSTVRILAVLAFLAIFASLTWYSAMIIVVCNLTALAFGVGFSMLCMPFTILFSDLQHTIRLILNYGIFLTPAMYQPEKGSILAFVIGLNPISALMQAARDVSTGAPISGSTSLLVVLGLSIVMSIAGIVLVRISTPIVIERMLVGGR